MPGGPRDAPRRNNGRNRRRNPNGGTEPRRTAVRRRKTGKRWRRRVRLSGGCRDWFAWRLWCHALAPQQASVAETDQYGWNRSERVAVSFENTDTASLRTMDVVVRYGSNFSYDRLVLAVTTVTPAGYRWRDTVVVHVPDGHPGLGLYRDVSQAYPQRGVPVAAGQLPVSVRAVDARRRGGGRCCRRNGYLLSRDSRNTGSVSGSVEEIEWEKDKIRRFAENATFRCVVQPGFEEVFRKDYALKGSGTAIFRERPTDRFGIGVRARRIYRGVGRTFPGTEFIGVDVKGARLARGQDRDGERNEERGFPAYADRIIDSCFAPGEVDEIWITFPIRN